MSFLFFQLKKTVFLFSLSEMIPIFGEKNISNTLQYNSKRQVSNLQENFYESKRKKNDGQKGRDS